MLLKYISINAIEIFDNIEPLNRVKLAWGHQVFPFKKVLLCNFNGKQDYFFAEELASGQYSSEYLFQYIQTLPLIEITSIQESYEILQNIQSKYFGTNKNYLQRKYFKEQLDLLNNGLVTSTTQLPTTTLSPTSTTIEPCSYGLVLSRVYNLNSSGECAICEPTEEFTCMSTENANKEDCEFQATQLNFLNPVCDTTPPPPI